MIEAQLSRRRDAVAAVWGRADRVVLIGAGKAIGIPGRGDLTYPFRAHSEYLYLTDRNRAGGVLAFAPREGWTDFVEPVTGEERLWSGARAGEPEGVPRAELAAWLRARRDRPVAFLGVPDDEAAADEAATDAARHELAHVRRVKDEVELERMRAAERATAAGFAAAAALMEPGRTEREVQIEIEAAFYRAGATALAFDTIVASGPNSAVLHFPPTHRAFERGDLVLVDAGGECRDYASDITRTYPVGGTLTAEQQELHGLVRSAELATIERCTDGTETRELQATAARVIAEGLGDFGLLRGDPDTLVESGAVALFFPHGAGHLLGLGIRDAGGSVGRPERAEFPKLRVDLPLRAGFVITVEPGIYFVPALLKDPERRRQHRDAVDWDRADRMLGFGGIRIEDDVLVGHGTQEVLTADVPVLG